MVSDTHTHTKKNYHTHSKITEKNIDFQTEHQKTKSQFNKAKHWIDWVRPTATAPRLGKRRLAAKKTRRDSLRDYLRPTPR